ncbi:6-phosphogluconolactonase [Candidatus Halocynthiibacter alkanivorans]|jgi:6-phosphogluconolactonase|uniref:6-phosphogluconolactonase n=1 Tax=Candidatus Halocynthiibacter alkanivorans TaxID=2267619 RepID=UPI000DF39ECD|nr:6-phosphogluconolactonase [Candidatus Halocynthiibacter alkanivorans]
MNLIEYPDRELMMIDLANQIAHELSAALHHQDRVSLSVPGGTTPGPIFDTLSAVDLDWSRVDVVLNDERWVPESSDRSNTRLLKARLFQGFAAKAHLLPLYAEAETPEERLEELSAGLEKALPLSVLLLGMGADMHTASLFPGADNLDLALSHDAPVLVAMRAPGAGEPRITLSAPVLKSAVSTHIVITGDEKLQALKAARHLTPAEAPVSAVLGDATVHWSA